MRRLLVRARDEAKRVAPIRDVAADLRALRRAVEDLSVIGPATSWGGYYNNIHVSQFNHNNFNVYNRWNSNTFINRGVRTTPLTPVDEGCFRPLRVVVPRRSVLAAEEPAFTEAALRALVWAAKPRLLAKGVFEPNGLE
jgi:hypothetical protein